MQKTGISVLLTSSSGGGPIISLPLCEKGGFQMKSRLYLQNATSFPYNAILSRNFAEKVYFHTKCSCRVCSGNHIAFKDFLLK